MIRKSPEVSSQAFVFHVPDMKDEQEPFQEGRHQQEAIRKASRLCIMAGQGPGLPRPFLPDILNARPTLPCGTYNTQGRCDSRLEEG